MGVLVTLQRLSYSVVLGLHRLSYENIYKSKEVSYQYSYRTAHGEPRGLDHISKSEGNCFINKTNACSSPFQSQAKGRFRKNNLVSIELFQVETLDPFLL